jgi:hypothetical protein
MKIQYGIIWELCHGRVSTLTRIFDCQLPIKTSLKIHKLNKILSEEFKIIEETRNELVKKYGEQLEDGASWKVKEENVDKFMGEFAELLKEETDINFEKIPVELLDNVKLSANELSLLENFIELDD